MRKLFFCARDLQDYLSKVKNVDCLNLPVAKSFDSALLDLPFVQKLLRSVSENEIHTVDEKICGETGIDGLRLDFNCGLRLDVPEGNFRVKISDFDSGLIFFDREVSDVRLISVEKFFIRWQVEIFSGGSKIFEHVLNLEGKPILLRFDKIGALGDTLALLPAVAEAQKIFNCRVKISLPDYIKEFAANLLPTVEQVDNAETYATYFLQMNFGDFPTVPADTRNSSLGKVASAILGLNNISQKLPFKPTAPPVTNEPYVCIAVQASTNRKCWLWPNGWDVVVDYLKSLGYRIFCIDKNATETNDGVTIEKPAGAEDFTGNFSIMERANMLYHAEFFIGLSSGLSWLADAVNCPVVMICGFSQDWSEFYTPYRVINRLVCNGCYSDIRVRAVEKFCPYHNGTPRELECQKKISPRQVLDAIERLIVDRNLTPPALRKISSRR